MSKKTNFLLAYGPFIGDDLSDALIANKVVDFVVHASSQKQYYEDEHRRYFGFGKCVEGDYDEFLNINSLPALSKDLMEKMLPYESMAIKLGCRTTNFPVIDYEVEKRRYYKHLRFWNYILDHHEINFVFFDEFPHMQITYVIYALAVIKKIPMRLLSVCSIPKTRICCKRIEDAGEDICAYYMNEARMLDEEELVLTGQVKKFYDRYRGTDCDVQNKNFSKTLIKENRKRVIKDIFGQYLNGNDIFLWQRKYLREIVVSIVKYHDIKRIKKRRNWLIQVKQNARSVRFYKKNMIMTTKQFNRFAVEPDYDNKYIYFALQLTPEETTMPRAGVFAEQYTSIQLIARVAEKYGLYVYVKEHYVQPFRSREVYEIIGSIPNVWLIKTSANTYDLLRNCVATATQTGTCMLEGAFFGKPSIVTSKGYYWKGMPGIYEIESEEQGEEVLSEILNSYSHNELELKRYLYAIQKKTIEAIMYMGEQDRDSKSYRKNLDNKLRYIQSVIENI